MDPTIAKLLADIRGAVATTGTVTDLTEPLTQRFSYNVPQSAKNRYPTFRVDFNLTTNHRLSASGNYHTFSSTPDTLNNREPFFPGFPSTGTSDLVAPTASAARCARRSDRTSSTNSASATAARRSSSSRS